MSEKAFTHLILNPEQIQQAVDGTAYEFEVPELTPREMLESGQVCCFRLRPVTLEQRDAAHQASLVNGILDEDRLTREMIVQSIIEPPVTEDHIRRLPFGTVSRLSTKVLEMSGLGANVAARAAVTFRPKS